MLAFIVPVKHPDNCNSYDMTIRIMNNTLRSALNQQDKNFRIVVVHNRNHPEMVMDSHIQYIEVGYPMTEKPKGSDQQYDWIYTDKGCKFATALTVLQKDPEVTHIMPLDCDDFVSSKLSGFVNENPHAPGWFVDQGYIYSGMTKIISELDEFWTRCGTSAIIRKDFLNLPSEVTIAHSREDIVEMIGDNHFLRNVLGDHRFYIEHVSKAGEELSALPFRGAIWHADTGENSSRAFWKQRRFGPIWGEAVSAEIADEFGLQIEKRDWNQEILTAGWRMRNIVARSTSGLLLKFSQRN